MDAVPPLRCTICDCLLIQPDQSRDGGAIAAAEARHYAEQHPLTAPRQNRTAPQAQHAPAPPG